MKKLAAALMCGTMTMSLFATAQAGETGSEQKDVAQEAIDARKEEAEKTGEYQKIVISFFDWTGAPAGIDRINEALSEHTRETLGVDVELMIIDSAAYSEDMKLMLSSGEQVDIFSTCGPGYMTCVNNGYTLDFEEDDIFQTYGKGIQEKVRAEYLDACRVGGVLYGAPPTRHASRHQQCVLDRSISMRSDMIMMLQKKMILDMQKLTGMKLIKFLHRSMKHSQISM